MQVRFPAKKVSAPRFRLRNTDATFLQFLESVELDITDPAENQKTDCFELKSGSVSEMQSFLIQIEQLFSYIAILEEVSGLYFSTHFHFGLGLKTINRK